AARAGVAAIAALFLVVGADAPVGVLVAVDPGAVADRFTRLAGERDLLGLAVVEIIGLVAARPDMVAILAVELYANGVGMAVVHDEGDVLGAGRGGEAGKRGNGKDCNEKARNQSPRNG